MITLEQSVELVIEAFRDMVGGEIYVKKLPSMKVIDIAKTIAPKAEIKIIGIRPGEKLHEQMISVEDSFFTYEYEHYFKILPNLENWHDDPERKRDGRKVAENFSYSSDTNSEWMSDTTLEVWFDENKGKLGTF